MIFVTVTINKNHQIYFLLKVSLQKMIFEKRSFFILPGFI